LFFFKDVNSQSASSSVPASPSSKSSFTASDGKEHSKSNAVISERTSKNTDAGDPQVNPTSVTASALGTDLDIGSLVQVDIPGSANNQFGVIRWMGILRDRDKPFVGVELVIFSVLHCSVVISLSIATNDKTVLCS